jgi:hypothetical protein
MSLLLIRGPFLAQMPYGEAKPFFQFCAGLPAQTVKGGWISHRTHVLLFAVGKGPEIKPGFAFGQFFGSLEKFF